MMNQNRWELLGKAFEDDQRFDEDKIADEVNFPELNLFDWLECDSSPSFKMREEFANHGYRVYRMEGDSFGWLVGGVLDRKTGRTIAFG